MTGQLRHLVETSQRPNVILQVLPLKAQLPLDQYVPFCLFTLRGDASIDVAWLEHATGGTLLEQRHDVQNYAQVWAELTAAALSPADSRSCLSDLVKEARS